MIIYQQRYIYYGIEALENFPSVQIIQKKLKLSSWNLIKLFTVLHGLKSITPDILVSQTNCRE